MLLFFSILIILFLLVLLIVQRSVLNNSKTSTSSPIKINAEKFSATKQEIEAVEKQIRERGIWTECKEWKLMTEIYSKIEPIIVEGKTRYQINVKCEIEITVTAYSIERAILFKNIFETLHPALYSEVGWAGWYNKIQVSEKI